MASLPSSVPLGKALVDQLSTDNQIGTGPSQLAAGNHTHTAATTVTPGFMSAIDKSKVDHLTITQPVDLDAIETRVNGLDAAVVLRGTWDASAGTFPGGGTAQAGDSYIVSVSGTVDGVPFVVKDRIIAIVDNASTTTFAANWFHADYTDAGGGSGDVAAEINAATAKTTPVDADTFGIVDSAASNVLKKLSWANVKATLKTYFDTLYLSLVSGRLIINQTGETPHANWPTHGRVTIFDLNDWGEVVIPVASNTADHSAGYEAAKAAGTLASPIAVSAGHVINRFQGRGYDGAAFQISGILDWIVGAAVAVSSGVVPLDLRVRTGTALGNITERFRISSAGVISTVSGYFENLKVGHLTDTIIARSAAGQISVAGEVVPSLSVAAVANRVLYLTTLGKLAHKAGFTFDPTTDTLFVANLSLNGTVFSGSALPDPNQFSSMVWDDVAGTTKWAGLASVLLTDGATITPDFNNRNFHVTLGGNRTLANPTNQAAGQSGRILITQDATGGRTFTSYGAHWVPIGPVTLNTAANGQSLLLYDVHASGTIFFTITKV